MKSRKPSFPSMRVDNKVAVVTGTGSGLGRSIALAFAHAGADVVVTELPGRLRDARTTASLVLEAGRKPLAISLDVTSLKSIERMVAKVIQEFGRIDILVNNAGI